MLLPWVFALGALASGPDLTPLEATFDRIVRGSRAEVGVALIHVESGARVAVRGDRRFPMASVYKLPIALELLLQVSQGTMELSRPVTLGPSDIRPCCTLSRRHPRGGVTMTAGELLELMIVDSDNTASDAVLRLVGGPAVVERRLRALGFNDMNVNRYEGQALFDMAGVRELPPEHELTLEAARRLIDEVPLAEVIAARARYTSDPRDTATPDEMARFLGRLQLGNLLPPTYTTLLLDLMARTKTGPQRLKARLPPETVVAHKTGTTDVVINDVGIITLPDRGADSAGNTIGGHLALAVFVMNGKRAAAMQRTIGQLAGAAFEFFTGKPLPPPEKPKPGPKKRKHVERKRPQRPQRIVSPGRLPGAEPKGVTHVRSHHARRIEPRLRPIGADLGRPAVQGDSGGRFPLLASGRIDRRSRSVPRRDRAAGHDLESRGPRRQHPPDGRLRDHPRADDIHVGERHGRIGPIHRRVGAAAGPLARRVGARHAKLSSPLTPRVPAASTPKNGPDAGGTR